MNSSDWSPGQKTGTDQSREQNFYKSDFINFYTFLWDICKFCPEDRSVEFDGSKTNFSWLGTEIGKILSLYDRWREASIQRKMQRSIPQTQSPYDRRTEGTLQKTGQGKKAASPRKCLFFLVSVKINQSHKVSGTFRASYCPICFNCRTIPGTPTGIIPYPESIIDISC